ncbi:MAG: outer membrane lipoprotein carrier protein LolA [Thermoanaerobaculia bacterium]|nr:outer membrane lipoprotein carrier protein LolA [Thermoanaerobaculia bacterium]
MAAEGWNLRRKSSLILVLALLGGGWLGAAQVPDPGDASLTSTERLLALVERMRIEQRGLRTLQASFAQTTATDLLLEDEESRGHFYYQAPDRVRWEYDAPDPKTIVINGDELTTFYADLGRAEIRHVGKYSDAVFKYLGASGSLETLMDYFKLIVRWPQTEADPYFVRLEPLYARVERRLKEMSVTIHGNLYVPVELEYVEPTGDSTQYRFSDFKVNQEIPADVFELDLPPEVEVHTVSGTGP